MHLTVYHARRQIPDLRPTAELAYLAIDVSETCFIVMAPGGENPQPGLDPARKRVGIRIGKRDPAQQQINVFRQRCLDPETIEVLGSRQPSTPTTSAFGARRYQPHISLLRSGNGTARDLTPLGHAFRARFRTLSFVRFEIRQRDNEAAVANVPARAG